MKFLKTFLFTISLTFISFGVVTLSGFCEAASVLTPDSSSFQAIQGGGMPYYYGMQGYGEMWFMGEEFNTTFMNDLSVAMQDGQDYVISQGYGLPTNGWGGADLVLANNLANLFSRGALDFAQMTAQNYALISHQAKQWGNNAKEYFIGKVDETTGVISDAVGNLVTKVTQEGINNYLGYSNQFVSDGTVENVSDLSYKFGRVFEFPWYDSSGNLYAPIVHLEFPFDVLVVTENGSQPYFLPFDSPSLNNLSCSGFYIRNNTTYNISTLYLYTNSSWYINMPSGKTACFSYGTVDGLNWLYTLPNYFKMPSGYNNRMAFASDFISSNPTAPLGYLYKYSSGTSLALQNLLNQLIGKYVDSNILDQINDKIAQAPIIIEYQNNEPVPVAEPGSDLLDEIGDLIDEAIANSLVYQQLLEPLEESEPEPEPDLEPNNQGTAVPEDFSTTIFSPINDSVGSVFDFVTIFEPLFYIFSFSSGLLSLWLVVPFVILFLILFRLLK